MNEIYASSFFILRCAGLHGDCPNDARIKPIKGMVGLRKKLRGSLLLVGFWLWSKSLHYVVVCDACKEKWKAEKGCKEVPAESRDSIILYCIERCGRAISVRVSVLGSQGRLHNALKERGWFQSVVSPPGVGHVDMVALCPACAEKVHHPDVLAIAKRVHKGEEVVVCDGPNCKLYLPDYPADVAKTVREAGGVVLCGDCSPPAEGRPS